MKSGKPSPAWEGFFHGGALEGVRMADRKPQYLPDVFWELYLRMQRENKSLNKRKSFFCDQRLMGFWQVVGKSNLSLDGAEILAGCVFAPLGLFEVDETHDSPGFKVNLKINQNEAANLMQEAEMLAIQLRAKLLEIEYLTARYPEEFDLAGIIENLNLEDELNVNNLSSSSPYFKVTMADVLHSLIAGLQQFPKRIEDVFPVAPGLHGQKSASKDYITQVKFNIKLQLNTYNLGLRKADWDALDEVMSE